MRYRLTTYRNYQPVTLAVGSWDAVQALLPLYGDITDVTATSEWTDVLVAKYLVTTRTSFEFLEVTVEFDGWEGCSLPAIMSMLDCPASNSYAEPVRFDIFDPRNLHEDPVIR